jgi:transposase
MSFWEGQVFRSLKSELGLRPNYHQKETRIEGHLFITLLAYHLVHTIRTQLKSQGIHDSWETLRRKLENQQRITVSSSERMAKPSTFARRLAQNLTRKRFTMH